jgi:hypothetical protein
VERKLRHDGECQRRPAAAVKGGEIRNAGIAALAAARRVA